MCRNVSTIQTKSTNYINESIDNTETMASKGLEFDENNNEGGNLDGIDFEINRPERYKKMLHTSATIIGEISQMFGKLFDYDQNGKLNVLLNMHNIKALKQGNA